MTDDLVGRHRAALIEAGREAGAFLADDVSDDFLLYVPGEVKGRIAKLTARIEALEAALRPFAEIAHGEVYDRFKADSRSTFRISNGGGDRHLTFINAECFDAARSLLGDAPHAD